jgi:hypothetical protein
MPATPGYVRSVIDRRCPQAATLTMVRSVSCVVFTRTGEPGRVGWFLVGP